MAKKIKKTTIVNYTPKKRSISKGVKKKNNIIVIYDSKTRKYL